MLATHRVHFHDIDANDSILQLRPMQTNKGHGEESREEGHLNAKLRPCVLAVETIKCEGLHIGPQNDGTRSTGWQLLLAIE